MKEYEDLLVKLKNTNKIVLDYIGVDNIIEKIHEDEGPINHYVEMHGFTYGPGEDIYEYREIDDMKEIEEGVERYYSELVLIANEFLKSIKKYKVFIEKLYNENDSKAWELIDFEKDPITLTLKARPEYDDDFVTYLFETYIL